MDIFWQDVRYAFRTMIKNPAFTLVCLLTLALGIGANTAIFSVVNGLLLRPLPFREPDRLVMVWQDYRAHGGPEREWASPDNFFDWRDQNQVFESMSLIDTWNPTLTGGQPEQLVGSAASYTIFSVLGVSPSIGRGFAAQEDKANGPRVVILSDGLWKRRFAADPQILGKEMMLNGQKFNVVGVMPANFEYPIVPQAELWTPLQVDSSNMCGRSCLTYRAIARLKPNVSLEQAKSDMRVIASRLAQQYPEDNKGIGSTLVPLQEQLTDSFRPALMVLLAAVGLVLLIACANVANLLLARASARKSEIAVRTAFGAGKLRLMRQILTESLLLSLLGGTAGVLLGIWGVQLLLKLLPSNLAIVGTQNIRMDSHVMAFAILLSLVAGVFFALVPLFQFRDATLNDSLKEGGRGRVGAGGRRSRSILVISEVAFALMLLIGAGLLMKSFVRLIHVNPGFNPDNILTMNINLPDTRYPENHQIVNFYSQLIQRIQNIHGVQSAGTISTLPLGGNNSDASFLIQGQPVELYRTQAAWYQQVSTGYFQTLGIPLVKGRRFTDADDFNAPRVVMVSEQMVRKFFPDGNAVGKKLNFNGPDKPLWREIVGVAADVKHFGLDRDVPVAVYFPEAQSAAAAVSLVVRTTDDPMRFATDVRAQVWSLDRDLAVSNVESMEQVVASTVNAPRITLILLAVFAGSALLLAAIGLYGVVSYSATQRTNEIGVRMALGAGSRDVLKMVVAQGMLLTAAGLCAGLVAAFALTRLMSKLLFGISSTDPWTFIGIPLLLALVALIASYIPARRASRYDPVTALRYE